MADPAGGGRSRIAPPWLARLGPVAGVSLGGAIGANARHLVGVWAREWWGAAFPWGTLLINVLGSLILGFYLTLAVERFPQRPFVRLLIATGFCGAFTTFSAFSYETVSLIPRGEVLAAAAYVGVSLIAGLLAVVVGARAARAI